MRKLFLISFAALLAAPLEAHNVVWNENSDGTTPAAPMVLYYDSLRLGSAPITIRPETGEPCTVMVSAAVTTSLIAVMIIPVSGGLAGGGNPAVTVEMTVSAIRAPVNGFETAIVSGEWHATGLTGAGRVDPVKCAAILPHPFTVTVNVLALPTAAQQPNAACTADPISTSTGEVMEPEIDLSLGGPLPLGFTRYYASMLNTSGANSALGPNWMHSFDQTLLVSGNTAIVASMRARSSDSSYPASPGSSPAPKCIIINWSARAETISSWICRAI